MKLKVLLAVPYKGNSIYELRKILSPPRYYTDKLC